MKFNRRQLTPRQLPENGQPLFAFTPIIHNIVAIIVIVCAYAYIVHAGLFPDHRSYIYWGCNALVTYNILISASRTFVAPILTLGAGLGFLFTSMVYDINLLSTPECWQLIVLGVLGFLITILLKL